MENVTDGEVVKMDTMGRTRVSAQRQAELLDEFSRSGMTGIQFTKWAGIKYSTFASWRKRQRRTAAISEKEKKSRHTQKPVQWVEALVDTPSTQRGSSAALVVEMGGGIRLGISDLEQARLAGVLLREMMGGAKPC